MDDHPRGLVHDEQPLVLVDDPKRDRLGDDVSPRRRRDVDGHSLPRPRAVAGLFAATVHRDLSSGDQRRGLRTGQPALGRDDGVESAALGGEEVQAAA
jgi:hypothetical protein